MNNSYSNQVTAIMLAPLRFSRPDGANDIRLDPVRSTSKFALRASMGQGNPGDPGDLSRILHLEHKDYPNKTWLWRIWVILMHNHSIGTNWIFAHWLIMVRSRNWPGLWWQISKIRDIQVVGIYDLMKRWRFETNRISSVATAQPQSQKPVFYFDLTWWPDL